MIPRSLQDTAVALFLSLWLAITPTFVWAGSMTLLGVGGPAAGVAYTGPADAITSPVACWSLRACTSALRGQKVANVCNSTGGVDVGCADMLSSASTGDLVSATVSGITCPGANCTVKTLYFQTGSLTCTAACDFTQATVANRPTLSTSCGGLSKAFCMVWNGSTSTMLASATTSAVAQPLTMSAVANRTTFASSSPGMLAQNGGTNIELIFTSSASGAGIYAGSAVVSLGAADNAWHSFQGVFNGASSLTNVDGVSGTTGNPGANSIQNGGTAQMMLGQDEFGAFLNGQTTEFLIYASAFSSGNSTTMCHNQFGYWGTSVSC